MTLFDMIGKTYDDTRQAGDRIVARLSQLLNLPLGSEIADIGAGTGNYSIALADAGFRVRAIEPPNGMRRQARQREEMEWLTGVAEHIPLTDASVDGVVSTLAVCHFANIQEAIAEMVRISCTKSIVIFTFDCDPGKLTWLYEYFPFLWEAFEHMPSTTQLVRMLRDAASCKTDVEAFPLPPDLKDNFAAASWRHPQRYLDEKYRANISSFRKAEPDALNQSIRKLAEDLASGAWYERYESVMHLLAFDAGYRFVFTSREEIPTMAFSGS
ncbi:MAG: class I SAM-dependent methyltransferase [Desulfatitalea sp.]|nr:class I SAM-dependent methyltransferase [Desulfatitalea sp.]NNJ99988.1 class I SAM-dependent methyltransferase [Desulfatitalea sp.]